VSTRYGTHDKDSHDDPEPVCPARATAHIGADLYEHTPTRTTQRNGTREKTVSTTAGT